MFIIFSFPVLERGGFGHLCKPCLPLAECYGILQTGGHIIFKVSLRHVMVWVAAVNGFCLSYLLPLILTLLLVKRRLGLKAILYIYLLTSHLVQVFYCFCGFLSILFNLPCTKASHLPAVIILLLFTPTLVPLTL